MPRLHVNVDHIATVRQARGGNAPDPVVWAMECETAGAHGITCHVRQDRRHIQDEDLRRLREHVRTLLNLRASLDEEMVGIALESGANSVCIVAESPDPPATAGGLDVISEAARIRRIVPLFERAGAALSLFVDPDLEQLSSAADAGIRVVELHTGYYTGVSGFARDRELDRLRRATLFARGIGLQVNAGHGLDYDNVAAVAQLEGIAELNVGHALVSRSLFAGVHGAVQEMLALIGTG